MESTITTQAFFGTSKPTGRIMTVNSTAMAANRNEFPIPPQASNPACAFSAFTTSSLF
jgi:hypothetical protein